MKKKTFIITTTILSALLIISLIFNVINLINDNKNTTLNFISTETIDDYYFTNISIETNHTIEFNKEDFAIIINDRPIQSKGFLDTFRNKLEDKQTCYRNENIKVGFDLNIITDLTTPKILYKGTELQIGKPLTIK